MRSQNSKNFAQRMVDSLPFNLCICEPYLSDARMEAVAENSSTMVCNVDLLFEVPIFWRWYRLSVHARLSWEIQYRGDVLLMRANTQSYCLTEVCSLVFREVAVAEFTDGEEKDNNTELLADFHKQGLREAALWYICARRTRILAAWALRTAQGENLHVGIAGIVFHVAKVVALCIRDVVVWRCVQLSGTYSEKIFEDFLNDAFNGALTSDYVLKSQLLNSFHHVFEKDTERFVSHSSHRRRKRARKVSMKNVGEYVDAGDVGGRDAGVGGSNVDGNGRISHGYQVDRGPYEELNQMVRGQCWCSLTTSQLRGVNQKPTDAIWSCAVLPTLKFVCDVEAGEYEKNVVGVFRNVLLCSPGDNMIQSARDVLP